MQKAATFRTATASALVQLNDTAFTAIATDGKVAKGDALTVAQLAGALSSYSASKSFLRQAGHVPSLEWMVFTAGHMRSPNVVTPA